MRKIVTLLRSLTGSPTDPSVTPPEEREAVVSRLRDQQRRLGLVDLQIGAIRPNWSGTERRRVPR